MKIVFWTLISAALALGQITVDVPPLKVSADGAAALYAWMTGQQSGTVTYLSVDVSASDTVWTVQDGAGINAAANSLLLIGGEVVSVTERAGRTLTVQREQLGTKAISHNGIRQTKDKDGNLATTNIGGQIIVLKYSTPVKAIRQWIVDKTAELMNAGGYPTAVSQDAIINKAKAEKDAAIAAAVQ